MIPPGRSSFIRQRKGNRQDQAEQDKEKAKTWPIHYDVFGHSLLYSQQEAVLETQLERVMIAIQSLRSLLVWLFQLNSHSGRGTTFCIWKGRVDR